jgi:putative methyltransferase (TIGR04325 family)
MKEYILASLRNLKARGSGSYRFSKFYDDFASALADSHGYENPGLVHLVSAKTRLLRQHLISDANRTVTDRYALQAAFVLAHIRSSKPLNVLEIGGACGALFSELNHLLPSSIGSWHIVETPPMAEVGRKLFEDDKLTFFDDLPSAASRLKPDLVIAQGVLQYMPNPLETWKALLGLGAGHVYVSRTVVGVDLERPIITKQVCKLSTHGPGQVPAGFQDRTMTQPMVLISSESYVESASGYRLKYSFNEGDVESYAIGSRVVKTRSVGFLFNKVEG